MGLSQALATGVSGLIAHQKALDNIGNNLANVNTVGFKKGVYQFSTLLEQSLRGGMSASGDRGSINPLGIGMGTQTGSISKVFNQGTLEYTGSATDLAIYGNGFFVLSTGSGYALTRDGSFYVSDDGYLMASGGLYVQGTVAVRSSDGSFYIPQDSRLENITIPLNSTGGMSKTSQISFAGNLNSTQSVASGLQLFGSTAPTVSNLQAWMSKNYNSTDTTWSALEKTTYFISQEMLDEAIANGVDVSSLPADISIISGGVTPAYSYWSYNTITGEIEYDDDGGTPPQPLDAAALLASGRIPLTEEITTINGGNVQTSGSFGIEVPAYLPMGNYEYNGVLINIQNDYTFPPWFYEANGGDFEAAFQMTNAQMATSDCGWPNGFQGDGIAVTGITTAPQPGETYPATLDTPLEHLLVYQGNSWTPMFSGISNGDTVTISFDKGSSRISADFTYNRPTSSPFGIQQKVDVELSYTLEHFLVFLAGDVDSTASACAMITPAMFGAVVSDAYPDGNPDTMTAEQFQAYEDALTNYTMAKSQANTNTSNTGAMGLVDVGPNISIENGGTDPYDSPLETAGAYTRYGVSQQEYKRYDPYTGEYTTVVRDSFNVSFVSNLGAENALSNIHISYNNTNLTSVFTGETEYSAPEGGSATATVTFYDSLGNPKVATLRLALVYEDSNFSTWRWYADSEDDTDFLWQSDDDGNLISSLNVGTGLFRFDTNGNFVYGSDYSETGGITINLVNQGVDNPIHVSIINGLSASLTQDLDFSKLTYSALENDLSMASQNGSAPGTLETFEISADGTINGVYSTGSVVPLGRLVLATVTNLHGLVATGDNLYYTSPASGEALYGYAETGGRGAISQYNLETSNVDLSEEFTKMIMIERGYQANSRIISTADNMLQELLSMVR
ncbi:MAG: flagellar hook-basal body complex protein [Planctomycetes bacterium]|nr:flagellar hook-basal body complex protein [Planctomycetota bacterium]